VRQPAIQTGGLSLLTLFHSIGKSLKSFRHFVTFSVFIGFSHPSSAIYAFPVYGGEVPNHVPFFVQPLGKSGIVVEIDDDFIISHFQLDNAIILKTQ
jgi:hypothetical protein